MALYSSSADSKGITAWRTSGKYKGSGFAIYYNVGRADLKEDVLYCIERIQGPNAVEKQRAYCQKLMQATYVNGDNNSYHYIMN